jgi:hypothetical protein
MRTSARVERREKPALIYAEPSRMSMERSFMKMRRPPEQSDGLHFSFFTFHFSLGLHVRLERYMDPRSFVDKLCVRQMVSDVR